MEKEREQKLPRRSRYSGEKTSRHHLMITFTGRSRPCRRCVSRIAGLLPAQERRLGRERLMVIDALMSRGLYCAMQAHTQMVREQLHAATSTLGMN